MGTLEIPNTFVRNNPVPLGEPDVLKTIQMMPGVQSGTEGFSGVYVRGGGQDETLFLLDGAPIYNVAHGLGLFSSFAPEAVKKVTLYKGPFPARFGSRVSGVVDVRTNDGNMYKTGGSVSVGILSDRIHVEGPVVREKLTWSFSARVLHTLLLAPVIKWAGADLNYYFYDFNGKLSWQASPDDRVFLSAYMGGDRFNADTEINVGEIGRSNILWGNRIVSLRWNHEYGDGLFSEVAAYYTNYRYDSLWAVDWQKSNTVTYTSDNISAIKDFGVTADFEWRVSNSHNLNFGISVVNHHYDPQSRFVVSSEILESPYLFSNRFNTIGWENALYVEDNMDFGKWLSVNLGIRGVQMTGGEKLYWSVEPRLSARVNLPEGFALKLAAGRSSQYVHLLSSSMAFLASPSDMWIPVTSTIKPEDSWIAATGVYWTGLPGWEFSVEAYLKHSVNVIDYKDGINMASAVTGSLEETVSSGESRSKGLEFFVQKTAGSTTGWLSYTLSKTDRRYPDRSINGGEWFPDKYDRRHNISVGVSHRFGERVDMSATWVFMSGSMTTVPENLTLLPSVGDSPWSEIGYIYAPYVTSRNNYRLPPSHRLNVSVNLHKKGRRGEHVWTFGVYNLYNAMNPNLVFIRQEGTTSTSYDKVDTELVKLTFLPVLPSVSYTFNF